MRSKPKYVKLAKQFVVTERDDMISANAKKCKQTQHWFFSFEEAESFSNGRIDL